MPATQVNVMEKYKAFANQMKTAEAEAAGWRPGAGTYICDLVGVTMSDRQFRYNKPKKGFFDGVGIQLSFKMNDTSSDSHGQYWRGKLWVFPNVTEETVAQVFGPQPTPDPEAKAETAGQGQWKRIQIQNSRFKGMVATLLGKPADEIDNIVAELALVSEDIEARKTASTDPIHVQVLVFWDKDQNDEPRYDREKITRLVDTAV